MDMPTAMPVAALASVVDSLWLTAQPCGCCQGAVLHEREDVSAEAEIADMRRREQ
jgi:hypothetical protein